MKDVTVERIIEILNENLTDTRITPEHRDEDLTKLGLDSLTFIQIIVSLEEEYDCEIPDTKILIAEMNTVNKIYDVLTSL